jgi:hypothetical protein
MIAFKLDNKNFNYLGVEYNIIKIDNTNFDYYKHHIIESINNFNLEINWNDMFNLDEVKYRLSNDMNMYIGILNDSPFGHVWFKEYEDGKYLYNLFVKNKTNIKEYTGKEFVSDIINRFEIQYPIYADVDDWNEKSIRLFKRLGFKVI